MLRFTAPAVALVLILLTGCSQSPQRLIETGNRYHAQKKYREASILYRKAIAKEKTNAEAYYREGLNLMDEAAGNSAKLLDAAGYLRRAVDLKPDNFDATTKLTEIYLLFYASDQKKFRTFGPEISDLTAKILKANPNSFDGTRLQGVILMVNHDLPNAIAEFEKALEIKPYSRDVVGWLAEAYSNANRLDDAVKLLRGMIEHDKTWDPAYGLLATTYAKQKNSEGIQEVFRLRLENNPTNPTAVVDYANFLLRTSRAAEGEEVIRRALANPKAFPDAHMMVGDYYGREADQERAKDPGKPLSEGLVQNYNKALAEFRAGADAHGADELSYQQRMVATLFSLDKKQEALDLSRGLAQKHPKDVLTVTQYASLLLETGLKGNVQQSIPELKRLMSDNPGNARLHYLLSRAYFEVHDFDGSLNEALEAIRENGRAMDARILAARVYEDRGQHGKALEQTELILNAYPANRDARLIKDRALIGLNELEKALPDLENLVASYPDDKDARLHLANTLLATHDYARAKQQFEKLWEEKDIRGFLGLQNVLAFTHQSDAALKNLTDAVAGNPNNSDLLYALANLQAQSHHYPEAAGNYQKLLKTNGNSGEIWLRLGTVQHLMGQDGQAFASLDRAQHADPRNTAAFLEQAQLLDLAGKKREAMDAYTKVLGMDPDNGVALNNLAFLEADANQNLDQALTYAEHAKKLAPNNADVADTLGFIYYQKNLNTAALQELRSAVDMNPDNASFRLHFAMALLKKGDKTAARSEASKALRSASPDEQGKIKSFMNGIS